jgi:glycosyltransferase involved in cell wall biosynthesis
MHILIVSHNYPVFFDKGFGFFCKDQAEALVAEGHRVGVVGPLVISLRTIIRARVWYFGFKHFIKNKVQTYIWVGFSVPGVKSLRYAILNRIGRKMVNRYMYEQGKPDAIHLHVFVAADVAVYASEKYKVPLIWTEHFSDVANANISDYERKLIYKLKVHSRICISVSRPLANKLMDHFAISSRVIHNMYNNQIFRLLPNTEKHSVFTFLTVAYMQPIKNHARMIDAFSLLRDLPVNLVLVGIGTTYADMVEKVKAMNLETRVRFLGELAPPVVALEMNKAHAYVVSSDFETFNVSIVEALACGLPVVSTLCGGPESIIVNEELGMLTNKTVTDLAQGMRNMFTRYHDYSREPLSLYAWKNYSIEGIAKKLTATYLECV